MTVLNALGVFYLRKQKTKKAVENLKNALKLARTVNDKKPHVTLALILKNMGMALLQPGKLDESLSYLVQAKEIMNKLLEPNQSHPLTSEILYNIGKNYYCCNNFCIARRCFEDAFKMKCEMYGENSVLMEDVCSRLAETLKKMGSDTKAIEYYTKAISIAKKIPLTKYSCRTVIHNLHGLASICWIQNEALKHLEEARKIAKKTGYEDWIVVGVLVALVETYAKRGSIFESVLCYLDARKIAMNLPKEVPLSRSISDMLIIMEIGPSP